MNKRKERNNTPSDSSKLYPLSAENELARVDNRTTSTIIAMEPIDQKRGRKRKGAKRKKAKRAAVIQENRNP